MDTKVEVRGIRELARAFKAVDADLPRQLKVRFLAIAEHVASSARSRITSRSGKAAASIKPRSSTKGAGIAFGGQAAEYAPWLDFGGKVGRNRSIDRKFIRSGRYVYPAIADKSDEIAQQTEDAVNDVARRAGFETKGGL